MAISKITKFLSFFFILISTIIAFEDKASLSRRLNFYKDIKKFSNNTITVGYSPEKGLFCVANDFIEYARTTLRIPKSLSLCPYYLFPFKYEIVSILKEMEWLKNTVGQQQKFSVYVLTYYILYFTSGLKEDVKHYIEINNLEQYFNLDEIDESLADSFPKIIMNSAFFEKEHYDLFNEMGFPVDKLNELENIYNHVLQRVLNNEHMEAIYPWISDFKKFKWAYSIVMSRGMTVRFREYMVLDSVKEKFKKFNKWDEINHETNKFISLNSGCPCIVAHVDLCNHYQPKFADMRDKRPIILDTDKGVFINRAIKMYHRGDEVTYTYINEPSNISMFMHYGFIMRNNIFDLFRMQVQQDKELNTEQLNLCKELGCVDQSVKDPSKIPAVKEIYLRLGQINEYLINYGRVKNIKGSFDIKKYVKYIAKEKPISYDNEVSAWMFYLNQFGKLMKGNYDTVERNIYKAQSYRNQYRQLEENWIDEDSHIFEWMNYKTYESIHLLSIYFRNVMMNHVKASYNKIIYHTKNEIDNIRNKYLSDY